MNVKPIDLLKVAELNVADWSTLWRGMDLINSGVAEADFPPDLHAHVWLIARACAVTNIGGFQTLRMVAFRLAQHRLTIERLRNALLNLDI